jgi:spore coat polysaccharide biosynthesis protein SpsF (cytidylyltransferase family)
MKNQKVISTIEARMASTRLPGKSLKSIAGKPALELLIERLKKSQEIEQIIVATTNQPEDDSIEKLCRELSISCYRGSPDDVLDRIVRAAESINGDIIAQITGDCILTCSEVTDLAIRTFRTVGCDYLSNLMIQTYPQGVDIRVFKLKDAKEIADSLAINDQPCREHPYLYFEEHPEKYTIHQLIAPSNHFRPKWRLDLDYEKDLQLLQRIFEDIYPNNPNFNLGDLIEYLDQHPELKSINSGVPRKPLRP